MLVTLSAPLEKTDMRGVDGVVAMGGDGMVHEVREEWREKERKRDRQR